MSGDALFQAWYLDQDSDDAFRAMVEFAVAGGSVGGLWKEHMIEQARGWLNATKPEEKLIRRIYVSNVLRFEEETKRTKEKEKEMNSPLTVSPLTVEEKLENALGIIRQLVEEYRVDEYASVVPLKHCDGCSQPYLQVDDVIEQYSAEDQEDEINLCKKCIIVHNKKRERSASQSSRVAVGAIGANEEDEGGEENDGEDEGMAPLRVNFQGRTGPKRSRITGVFEKTEDGALKIRLDDASNLEFWAETVVSPDVLRNLIQ